MSRRKRPHPPDYLSPAQKKVWKETAAQIHVGEMTPIRLQRLEAYAVERARWLEAELHLAEHGDTLTLRSDKGLVIRVVESAYLKLGERARDRALKLAIELGLGK